MVAEFPVIGILTCWVKVGSDGREVSSTVLTRDCMVGVGDRSCNSASTPVGDARMGGKVVIWAGVWVAGKGVEVEPGTRLDVGVGVLARVVGEIGVLVEMGGVVGVLVGKVGVTGVLVGKVGIPGVPVGLGLTRIDLQLKS